MTNNLSGILEGLDSSQKEAVRRVEGPELIVAGAGSGKTRVLTSRIAYIIGMGCEPSEILALTFTKKAAEEMKERVADMVGERNAQRIYMGTFHSVFIRFLREYAERLGYPSAFTIYDTGDSQSAIKRIIKEMQLDDKVYKPKDVLSRISMAKNNLVTPEAYRQNQTALENDRRAKKGEIVRIYAIYQNMMLQSGVMDFDDILLNMNILLKEHPDALEAIASRFRYILVDEYQDTNYSQYLILKKLGGKHRNICVVGDDSQSIYAFRGAKIENILNFKKDYPDCSIFRLEQNYRSTKNIVDAANSVIANNEARIPKTCFSKGSEGEKIRLIKAYTEQEEALLITSSIIGKMQEEHSMYQDFAVLYRTNSQSRAIEEAFRKRNLPYLIYSGNSFFDRAEVKDMMAYLKLAVNPKDDEAFRRAVNKPARGIGETSVSTLEAAAKSSKKSMMEAAYIEGLEAFGLKPAAISKIRAFTEMIGEANAKSKEADAYSLASSLADSSGLYRFFKEDNSIESQSRAANIEELVNSVKLFTENRQNELREEIMADLGITDPGLVKDEDLPVISLGEYLENISLLSAVDVEDEDDNRNKISLMTIHSSKGLEFPHVYVAGMEENIFPSGGVYTSPAEIEEERRLFYVAMTRAKSSLHLAFAGTRMRNGKHESNPPSRFIREIDVKYIANPILDGDMPVSGKESFGFGSLNGRRFGMGNSGAQRYGRDSRAFIQKDKASYESSVSPSFTKSGFIKKTSSPPAAAPDPDFIPVSVLELKAGQIIEHNRFGLGKIIRITGEVEDLKALIDFDSYGEKILILKYAKIRFPKKQ